MILWLRSRCRIGLRLKWRRRLCRHLASWILIRVSLPADLEFKASSGRYCCAPSDNFALAGTFGRKMLAGTPALLYGVPARRDGAH
jgi:hypothetical protein